MKKVMKKVAKKKMVKEEVVEKKKGGMSMVSAKRIKAYGAKKKK